MKKKHVKRDPSIVSFTMSHIRGKDTSIELKLRKALTKEGLKYRCNSSKVFGHPDIVSQKLHIAIFCDSEFWHGYEFEENKKNLRTHRHYWLTKIQRNMKRDELVNKTLKEEGYVVFRFWGKQIEKDLDNVVKQIMDEVRIREKIFSATQRIKIRTTLCYLEKDNQYLMLYRDKKQNDVNEGKWIGVGGHVEEGESITACLKREIKEETGLDLLKSKYKGYVDFLYENQEPERMYLYLGTSFEGTLIECDEGELAWKKKEDLLGLPLWEGDKVFLPLLNDDKPSFGLSLLYKDGKLEKVVGPIYKSIKKP